MPDNETAPHKGHIMATLRVDKILLKYFDKSFNFQSNMAALRRRVADTVGLADRERFDVLREEADRLEGLIKKNFSYIDEHDR